MPPAVVFPIGRSLVYTRGIGKGRIKNAIKTLRQIFKYLRKTALFFPRELIDIRNVPTRNNHSFVWPDGPKGNQGHKGVIRTNDSFAAFQFLLKIIRQ